MDARSAGGDHRGRGPKNYQRSDERIREDVNDRLTDNSFIDAANIEVEVSGREVILTGTVNSRYEKRLAEDIAEDVSGVSDVENRLKVKRNTGEYAAPSYQGSTTTSNQGGLESLPSDSSQSRTASSSGS
jgi:Flp pilus assembly secretin CpaC